MAQPQQIKQALASSYHLAANHTQPTSIMKLHNFDVAKAVHDGHLTLSVSPLLGCDYAFVYHKGACDLLNETNITSSIQELIEILELSPRQSVIVSVNEISDEEMTFTRHDYSWNNHHVTKVITMPVTHQEQIDFMHMMLNCSSTC
jgi:hypothetical protein